MNTKKMVNKIIDLIRDKKGINIVKINLRGFTDLTDYFIIATGNSNIHLKAMTKYIAYNLKINFKLLPGNPIKDLDNNWILIDYGDFIIHLFTEKAREFYNLEGLWADAKREDY